MNKTDGPPLLAVALAVSAPWPAAGATLTLLQLLLGSANASLSSQLLFRFLNPTDELIAGQRSDVVPSIERSGVRDQGVAQVRRKLVDHPTRHPLATHEATVAGQRGRDRDREPSGSR